MAQDTYYALLNNLPQSPSHQQIDSLNLLEKLRNGHIYTDDERNELSVLAQSAEDEITQLESVICSLKAMKDEISYAAGLARAVLAPIWKIPEEILLEIFAFSGTATVLYAKERSKTTVAANVLSSVCLAWYKLVQRTASLWTVVDIWLENDLATVKPLTSMVKQVFEKSGNLPLDLFIQTPQLYDHRIPPPLTDLLKDNQHRWKYVRMDCPSMVHHDILGVVDTLPALARLELITHELSGPFLPVDSSISISAPNLRELSLWKVDSPLDFLEGIPWDQLEAVTLAVVHIRDYFDILSRCTALKNMILWRCSLKENIPYTPLSSNLVSLGFCLQRDGDNWAMGMCFDYLTLPCLQEYDVTCRDDWLFELGGHHKISWPASRFLAFLDRSGCALKTFRSIHFPISDSDLLDIMLNKAMRTVETFDFGEPLSLVDASGITSRLIQKLYIKEGDASEAALLPKMRTLKLIIQWRKKGFPFQMFFEMVSSRRRLVSGGRSAVDGGLLAALREVNLDVWEQDIPPSAENELYR
jgi:hypothetical protein